MVGFHLKTLASVITLQSIIALIAYIGIPYSTSEMAAVPSIPKMPVIFIAHGSPMNALMNTPFTSALAKLGESVPTPKAILLISAHWLTRSKTQIDNSLNPKTLYDFGGFPRELSQVQYPAPGSPELAQLVKNKLERVPGRNYKVETSKWGLDHGAWTILKHMYPKANVPVFQLSIDFTKPPEFHYELGKQLAYLRDEGVLILGSGNVVHNLALVEFHAPPADMASKLWAQELSDTVKKALEKNDTKTLIDYENIPGSEYGIASPDHYYPLLYCLGAAQGSGKCEMLYEGFEYGTLDMRCVRWN